VRNAEQINLILKVTEAVLLFGALTVWILFLRTQYRTLKAVKPANRGLKPGLVWLQFIPVFGQVWQFFVVVRIADSLRKEKISRMEESLMSNLPPPSLPASNHPTLGLGLTFCIFTAAFALDELYIFFRPRSTTVTILLPVVLVAGSICFWIAYWVNLGLIRHKLTGPQ
jgi:hypothetical protein